MTIDKVIKKFLIAYVLVPKKRFQKMNLTLNMVLLDKAIMGRHSEWKHDQIECQKMTFTNAMRVNHDFVCVKYLG